MNTRDVTENLPSAEDLLHALGLQRERGMSDSALTTLGVFGAGVMLGVGLALWLAPLWKSETDGGGNGTGERTTPTAATTEAAKWSAAPGA